MNASGAINATDKNYVSGWITTGPTAPDCFEFYGEYVYDALGRRIRATADGVTTYFYYDGQNVVAEYDRDLDLLRYYVHGSTYIDERAILHDAVNDEEYYYALRELYTVEALLNNRAHEVERYTYDAYGRPTINILSVYDVDFDGDVDWRDHDEIGQYEGSDPCGNAGPIYDTNGDGVIDYTDQPSGPPYPPGIVSSPTSGVGNPYAFTGRRLDHFDNFGLLLYHYRAREYDPFHGRFLQRDPAEYVDGGNLYEYATSSPLRYHDPLGTQIIESFDHFKDFAPSWTGPPKVKGRVFTYQPPFGSGLTFSYFYDFYNGSHPNRKNPKITDAVIVLGSFTDAIRSQSQVLDYEDLTVDRLRNDARKLMRDLDCDDVGGFRDASSKVVTADLASANVRTSLQRFTVYWEAKCAVGPKQCFKNAPDCRSGFANEAPYECEIVWIVYDRYDFQSWNPWGWVGTPFDVYTGWTTLEMETATRCTKH